MGLFHKKEKVEEKPAEDPIRRPSDEDNWHSWYNIGNDYSREGKIEKACSCWVEAMDRFDGSSKNLTKIHDDIYNCMTSRMYSDAAEGVVVPMHLLAEIDTERRVKHPDLEWTDLSEDIFYFAKENYLNAKGPQHAVMLYVSAAYSILGYLRYAGDLREMSSKCEEVSRLGEEVGKHCMDYPRVKYIGNIKPSIGKEYVGFVVDYFKKMRAIIDENIQSMSDDEIAAVRDFRAEHPEDQLDPLVEALRICLDGHAHLVKPKAGSSMDAEMRKYMAAVRKTD